MKFSIYNPAITYEHREVYDAIVSQLQQIAPICNQGRCKATEITSSASRQMEVNALMEQVELFSSGLLDVTKKFFDQLYQSKEEYNSAIALSTTSVKLDMIERNLLERTCDVRWWALEKAFWECISLANRTRDALKSAPSLLNQSFCHLQGFADPSTETLLAELQHLEQLLIDNCNAIANPKVANQALSTLTATIHAMQAHQDGQWVSELQQIKSVITDLQQQIDWACTRLEDIRASYTLYRDLVIVDQQGTVIANANPDRRERVLGLDVSKENWCIQAGKTRDGTEYYAQDFAPSKVEDVTSLVYATALRNGGNENAQPIGTMGIFFDFQGEAQLILNDYLPQDEYGAMDGWFSFFSNQHGYTIASSDEGMLPVDAIAETPKGHRNISKSGEEHVGYCIFKGVQSLVISKRTKGFDEYDGLGWRSHFILPQSAMFEKRAHNDNFGLDASTLMESRLVPEINKTIYREIVTLRRDIQYISLNGIILATKLGNEGASFMPIFNKITATGNSISDYIETLLGEMAEDMLLQNLNALKNFSKQAIDLIDRNLFERAADVRWWATDHAFWQALETPSESAYAEASTRLGIINGSYTMYRDLILADKSGCIVATSKAEDHARLSSINVSEQPWFQQGGRVTNSIRYGVQNVCNSNLEKTESSLIYCGGIIRNGQRSGHNIGVLGILFDWQALALPILQDCLPQQNGQDIPGSAAFYLDNNHAIIASTDEENFPLYAIIDTGHDKAIGRSESLAGVFSHAGGQYIIGSSGTQGYREYEGLQWTAHVVRPID
ncbi:MAG: cache domain-containing protein [Mariprofundaceae bacterium]|nr:cache domain-containing protein [Mariprofundaceae bacterium]